MHRVNRKELCYDGEHSENSSVNSANNQFNKFLSASVCLPLIL